MENITDRAEDEISFLRKLYDGIGVLHQQTILFLRATYEVLVFDD
jgi:hypothetical protein